MMYLCSTGVVWLILHECSIFYVVKSLKMADIFKSEYKDKIDGLLSALYNKRSVLSPSYNMARMGSSLMTPISARKRSLLNMYAKVWYIMSRIVFNLHSILFLSDIDEDFDRWKDCFQLFLFCTMKLFKNNLIFIFKEYM